MILHVPFSLPQKESTNDRYCKITKNPPNFTSNPQKIKKCPPQPYSNMSKKHKPGKKKKNQNNSKENQNKTDSPNQSPSPSYSPT